MDLFHVVVALLFNPVAFKYAVCGACVLAPLYAFLLMPAIRCATSRACAPSAVVAPRPPAVVAAATAAAGSTPVRLSTASSTGTFLSPHSVGATPMAVTPLFHESAASPEQPGSTARSRSRSGSSKAASPEGSRSRGGSALPSLAVAGTAVRLEVEGAEYRSPTERFVSALKRQVQQRGSAVFGREDDGSLRAAVESGEVYFHRPARRLPSLDYLALRLLRRQERHALYEQLNITEASLNALYASPKFQEWYSANHEQLQRDAQLREAFYWWRSLARAAVLLVALLLLPAFSFSADTTAAQWQSPLLATDSSAAVAAAPFAQLLLTRMSYIQHARSVDGVAQRVLPFVALMRADLRTFVASAVSMAEWAAVVVAVCSLVTSCFMPRGSRRTASVALTAFVVVLLESMLVTGVSLRPGLGSLLIVTVVGTKIRRAAE